MTINGVRRGMSEDIHTGFDVKDDDTYLECSPILYHRYDPHDPLPRNHSTQMQWEGTDLYPEVKNIDGAVPSISPKVKNSDKSDRGLEKHLEKNQNKGYSNSMQDGNLHPNKLSKEQDTQPNMDEMHGNNINGSQNQ